MGLIFLPRFRWMSKFHTLVEKGSFHLKARYPKSQKRNPSFGEKLRERNDLKHVVILKETLPPQYGYYGFALLRDISRDYVFGDWVRENLFMKLVAIIFHIVNIFL